MSDDRKLALSGWGLLCLWTLFDVTCSGSKASIAMAIIAVLVVAWLAFLTWWVKA